MRMNSMRIIKNFKFFLKSIFLSYEKVSFVSLHLRSQTKLDPKEHCFLIIDATSIQPTRSISYTSQFFYQIFIDFFFFAN